MQRSSFHKRQQHQPRGRTTVASRAILFTVFYAAFATIFCCAYLGKARAFQFHARAPKIVSLDSGSSLLVSPTTGTTRLRTTIPTRTTAVVFNLPPTTTLFSPSRSTIRSSSSSSRSSRTSATSTSLRATSAGGLASSAAAALVLGSSKKNLFGTALATLGNLVFPRTASLPSKVLRATALSLAAFLAASPRLRHRVLWPGMKYPSGEDAELLPGPLGCPFVGSPQLYITSDSSYGAGSFYRYVSKSLGKALGAVPRIWKYYFFGQSFAVVSGGKTFQNVLGMEFEGSLTSSGVDLMEGGLMPTKSLLFEREKKRHSYLRRLVGAALTPNAVAKAAPTLQSAAEEQVARMIATTANSDGNSDSENTQQGLVQFHKVCTDYTLDVAWRQILGLQLTEEEIPHFEENVATWIDGIMTLRIMLGIGVESTPGYAAREYVISKIEERIDQLLEQGPDNTSTLSGMVFATDDEGGGDGKKLSRQEIIDNALILIFAGSETSASTLANAMLFLGLHPSVWNKLVEEQAVIQKKHGDELTRSALDVENAPYLDVVLKETLRMRTVVGGIPRMVLKDIDVDGDGKTIIPKGWLIDPSMLLTHEEDPNSKLPDAMHLDAIQGFRPDRWLRSEAEKPDSDWYVPYGFGPRYCLGKNLAQLEMKVFLATMARKIDFPKLDMLPEGYEYPSDKKMPDEEGYFSVEWKSNISVIPTAADGVLAAVTSSKL